ncbi:small subunit of clathrin adaptor complex [Hamiltosporidium tvaerminnensis]|uniref:AP complex subunit sigma n=2 Tax=Hamiltosporidium TaxID=1176354 RepID=A0A4Q9LR36_9MICR|nr:small subunit of clathrin adaptor complex [Hamiltosporidium tvaerminnensis]TBU09267.1 small subunit of clathrin adaptor complex [Hamiltosporidium magnivora]TBU09880.1 small subunit of clathrin adaptor complex [Hamiltosporidium magnivora]TBU11090.1 small subunit of clathrin adaptor complex [Hamiltosporidium tvaerminnensis]TBU12313.1 small subunit of clathrin adaptor complex [Hamiltosporidium tvaerminnensis]
MILKILGFNRKKEIRITRTYFKISIDDKTIIKEILLLKEPDKIIKKEKFTILFEKFASIILCFVVDNSENLFYISNAMNTFVIVLDKYFKRVCELNLIYSFDKVHYLLDNYICNGKVIETDEITILNKMNIFQEKILNEKY